MKSYHVSVLYTISIVIGLQIVVHSNSINSLSQVVWYPYVISTYLTANDIGVPNSLR